MAGSPYEAGLKIVCAPLHPPDDDARHIGLTGYLYVLIKGFFPSRTPMIIGGLSSGQDISFRPWPSAIASVARRRDADPAVPLSVASAPAAATPTVNNGGLHCIKRRISAQMDRCSAGCGPIRQIQGITLYMQRQDITIGGDCPDQYQ